MEEKRIFWIYGYYDIREKGRHIYSIGVLGRNTSLFDASWGEGFYDASQGLVSLLKKHCSGDINPDNIELRTQEMNVLEEYVVQRIFRSFLADKNKHKKIS